MDILFVHPGSSNVIYQELSERFSAIEPPTWALLHAESCRQNGIEPDILDCDAERLDIQQSFERIQKADPKMIVFVVYGSNPNAGTTKMSGVYEMAQLVKSVCNIPIVVVGSHASALPKEVLSNEYVDYVAYGDGVYAIQDLWRQLFVTYSDDVSMIGGIGWKHQGEIVLNENGKIVPQDKFHKDLPGYAWDLLPKKEKLLDLYRSCNWHADFKDELRSPYAAIYTSLGCRFKCDFCLLKGTKVITPYGEENIENVEIYDTLVAFDPSSNQVVETIVQLLSNRIVDRIYKIKFDNGKVINCSEEHPIFINWKWVPAKYVNIGDKGNAITENNSPYETIVESVTVQNGQFEVYNFRCEPYNNFYAEYVLTHNCMINSINRTSTNDGYSSAQSSGMRFWEPDTVFSWIKNLYDNNVRTIRISDEMFFLDKRYFEPLLQKIADSGMGQDLRFWTYARVDTVRPKFLDLFRAAGVRYLALGIESSNTAIRKEVTKGTYEETDVRDVVKQIQDHGISVISNYIFGLPNDTYETMNETLDLALELNTEMANFYPAAALPGSPLYQEALKQGWELPKEFSAWSFHSYDCLPLPTKYLSPAEVLKFRDNAWKVYFNSPDYLSMIKNKFGDDALQHIKDMTAIQLKRKLLHG